MIIIGVTLVVIGIASVSMFFTNSNMFLFFLMLVLYGLSIIGISFSLTPFFNKAQVSHIEHLSTNVLSINFLNFLNGIIHLPILELSIIIFRDIKM